MLRGRLSAGECYRTDGRRLARSDKTDCKQTYVDPLEKDVVYCSLQRPKSVCMCMRACVQIQTGIMED